MENCLFCRITRGEIPSNKVFENEEFIAFLDINPINPGHTLVVPKKHADYLFDLDDNEYSRILKTAKFLAPKIQSAMNSKRIGIIVEGFLIPHVHIHLIPLHHGGELN
ncbi:MAG: HIT domain-containing protein, partial [Candidatus Micrarchaeota archaeon]